MNALIHKNAKLALDSTFLDEPVSPAILAVQQAAKVLKEKTVSSVPAGSTMNSFLSTQVPSISPFYGLAMIWSQPGVSLKDGL